MVGFINNAARQRIKVETRKARRIAKAIANRAAADAELQAESSLAPVATSGDSDDLSEGSTNLLLTGGERTKIGHLTVTGAVDLDALPRKYAASIGNGSDTTIDVAHNLGTRDITYSMWEASGSYLETAPATAAVINTNTLRLTFGVAPSNNQYRIAVTG